MILPGTHVISIVLLVLSMLCLGSWANTFKLSGNKWRFELFYYDFAIGFFFASLLVALTFGSLGFDGFSFTDDFLHAGKRQILFGFTSGVVFNLANMLLVGAISIAGMSVALPIGLGMAFVVGVIWSYLAGPTGNSVFLFTGVAVVIGAIVLTTMAYRSYQEMKLLVQIESGKAKSTRVIISMKGVVISLIGGLLMGCFFPILQLGQTPEIGLGPYAITVVFAIGVLFSTFVYNLFFTNLPVQGEPVDIVLYFRTTVANHVLGLLGGALFCFGILSSLVALSAEGAAKVTPGLSFGLGQCATVLAALWGILVWKEFAGSDARVKILLGLMIVLFLIGIGLISTAPTLST